MPYSRTTWVDGSTPVSAGNMNNIEGYLAKVGNPTGVVLNGGSGGAGSVTCYQVEDGTIKRVMLVWSGYKSGSSAQTLALPTAFTVGAHIRAGGIGVSGSGGMQLLASSSPINMLIYTALASAGGTPSGSLTTIYAYSFAEAINGFDTIGFPSNTSSVHNCFVFIEGQ